MLKSITEKEYRIAYRTCLRYNAKIKPNIEKLLEETDLLEQTINSLKKHDIHTVKDIKKYYIKYGNKLFTLKYMGIDSIIYIGKLLSTDNFRIKKDTNHYKRHEVCRCDFCKPKKHIIK